MYTWNSYIVNQLLQFFKKFILLILKKKQPEKLTHIHSEIDRTMI